MATVIQLKARLLDEWFALEALKSVVISAAGTYHDSASGKFTSKPGGSKGRSFKEFDSSDDFSAWASDKTGHSAWKKSLDENEGEVVSAYAADTKWCRNLNDYTRGDSGAPHLENAKNVLSSAIAKSKGLPEGVQGFRDVHTTHENAKVKYAQLKVGDTFTEDAFTSVGARPTAGYRNDGSFGNVFGDFRLQVRIPQGTKAIFPNLSSNEAEILLQRGTRFKVLEKSKGGMVVEVADQPTFKQGYSLKD